MLTKDHGSLGVGSRSGLNLGCGFGLGEDLFTKNPLENCLEGPGEDALEQVADLRAMQVHQVKAGQKAYGDC